MTDRLKCSFCGKSQDQVKKLIAGPGVFICDECVELCVEILEEENFQIHTGKFKFMTREVDLLKKAKSGQDEKLKSLIVKVVEPLEQIIDCYSESEMNPYFEPVLRTLVFLKLQHDGKYTEDLIPHLESLAETYSTDRQYDLCAEVLEWILEIKKELGVNENDQKLDQIVELVRAHMKSKNFSRADEWLNRLKSRD